MTPVVIRWQTYNYCEMRGSGGRKVGAGVRFIEEVITKTIEYHLFDIVVVFHRFHGALDLRLYRFLKETLKPNFKEGTEEVHEGTEEVQESTAQVHEGTAQEKKIFGWIKISVKGKLSTKEDFVSFREMITSQLQGKLWLYDEVRTRLCLFCHHQIGEDCWDS
ncbi:hypothetical protein Tco_0760302 [Tanacetum coccineum]